MNNELWKYVQELKKGNIQLADLKECLSATTGNSLQTAFAGLPADRPMAQKAQSMKEMWP